MIISKMASFGADEVIEALQAVYPALCGGKRHRLEFKEVDRTPLYGTATRTKILVVEWDEPEKTDAPVKK